MNFKEQLQGLSELNKVPMLEMVKRRLIAVAQQGGTEVVLYSGEYNRDALQWLIAEGFYVRESYSPNYSMGLLCAFIKWERKKEE